MSNLNQAAKALHAAKSDFWEAQYLVGTYITRKHAKRDATRARRRLAKAAIKEQTQ
jgi:hypothetical protein